MKFVGFTTTVRCLRDGSRFLVIAALSAVPVLAFAQFGPGVLSARQIDDSVLVSNSPFTWDGPSTSFLNHKDKRPAQTVPVATGSEEVLSLNNWAFTSHPPPPPPPKPPKIAHSRYR
jgi:hypothetical protein